MFLPVAGLCWGSLALFVGEETLLSTLAFRRVSRNTFRSGAPRNRHHIWHKHFGSGYEPAVRRARDFWRTGKFVIEIPIPAAVRQPLGAHSPYTLGTPTGYGATPHPAGLGAHRQRNRSQLRHRRWPHQDDLNHTGKTNSTSSRGVRSATIAPELIAREGWGPYASALFARTGVYSSKHVEEEFHDFLAS